MPSEGLRYQEPSPLSRTEAERRLRSDDPAVVCPGLVDVAFYEPDWRWVQEHCLRLADSVDPNVRGIAATCLGHLARIHRTLDLERALPVLRRLQHDKAVQGQADEALDDIGIFIEQAR